MDIFYGLYYGLSIGFQPINLVYCFLGVFLGTLVGVLPGLGPTASIALLLPTVFHLPPISSIIMLAGICYGVQYGGSTTSILVNIPGEASTVITCLDGHQMALKGRAGPALGMAAFGSCIAGTFGVVGLMLFAPILARFALRFGPPEYFSLALMSLTLIVYVSKGSVVRSLIGASLGVIMGTVGMDPFTSRGRFTYGLADLLDGLDIVYVSMGLFGMGEVLYNLGQSMKREIIKTKVKNLLPNRQDWKDSAKPIFRGTLLGFFLGILPGLGTVIPTFISYAVERKFSRHPEKFGTGTIEGVAGPESANNAAASGAFIPMFSLGIPANPSTAILLAALMVLGLQPGPLLITSNPDLFWGVVASMYIGNLMLLVLNLPLIGLWVQVLKVPYSILFVMVTMFCQIGAYSVNSSVTDVLLMNIFGLLGYLMKRYEFQGAPLIFALIMGPMLELSLRRSLILGEGNLSIFFSRPLSAIFLVIAIISLVSSFLTRERIGKKAIEMQD